MVSRSRSEQGRARRGFAAMDPEERREISRRGGTASHESGRGHEFNSQEARAAGRLGSEARWGRSRSRSHTGASSRSEPEEEEGERSERRYTPDESELGGYRPSRTRETEEERGVEYDHEQRRSEGSTSESRLGRSDEEEERGGGARGRRGSGLIRSEEPRTGRSRGGRSRSD